MSRQEDLVVEGPYPLLLSGIQVGPLTLKNRLVMGAMHTRLEGDPAGYAAFLRARADGGAALLITGGFAPSAEGRIDESAPVFDSTTDMSVHRAWCDHVHAGGAALGLQLLHAGRYADLEASVAPSPIPWGTRSAPRELSIPEIQDVVDSFAAAAGRARVAGYDAVEVMGSEGYLLHQFAARCTNQRTDRYGGSWEGRRRLPVDVVRAVRDAIGPDVALIVRVSALDLVPDGLTREESIDLARVVVDAGADALDSGIGWHESTVPTISGSVPRTAWSAEVQRLRDSVSVPVIATNRINSPADAERLLRSGVADLISMARPLLADPDFLVKAAAGRTAQITPCVACNQSCLDRVLVDEPVRCLVNPKTGRESERVAVWRSRQRVAVVGGGPAGMSCAVTLAENGHEVTLFDAADALGGQLRLAMVVPGKGEFAHYISSVHARLENLGVMVRLGQPVTAVDIADSGFDHVVIATGTRPRIPGVPGLASPSVVTYVQVLSGEVPVGTRVAILGAGGVGLDVALFLSVNSEVAEDIPRFRSYWDVPGQSRRRTLKAVRSQDRQITMFQRSHATIGRSLGPSTGWILKHQLRQAGVQMVTGATYGEVIDGHFSYRDARDEPQMVDVDQVIVCTGQISNRDVYDDPRLRHPSVHLIGGARIAQGMDAALAIAEGSDAGRSMAGIVAASAR